MRSEKVVGGVFLIAIGFMFLLSNLGIISWSILGNLFQLWPLILVVIGVNIIFKNTAVVKGITWLMFFVVFIGYGFINGGVSLNNVKYQPNSISVSKTFAASTGKVNIDFGGANLDISSTNSNLMEAYTDTKYIKPHVRYINDNKHVVIDFKSTKNNVAFKIGNNSFDYSLKLDQAIVWDIDANLGAVSGRFDLTDLKIDRLDLDLGASNLEILLGDKNSMTEIKVDAGASNLDLVIPESLGLMIKVDGLISKTSLTKLGWMQQGGYYVSPNYDDAESRAKVNIDLGVGKLDIMIR